MKCPYCHIEFNSQAGYKAHKDNCMHKDDPLPEPIVEKEFEDCTVKELTQICKDNDISGYSNKAKDELIKLIKEVV